MSTISLTAPSAASIFITASVSITSKYGQPCVCHPGRGARREIPARDARDRVATAG